MLLCGTTPPRKSIFSSEVRKKIDATYYLFKYFYRSGAHMAHLPLSARMTAGVSFLARPPLPHPPPTPQRHSRSAFALVGGGGGSSSRSRAFPELLASPRVRLSLPRIKKSARPSACRWNRRRLLAWPSAGRVGEAHRSGTASQSGRRGEARRAPAAVFAARPACQRMRSRGTGPAAPAFGFPSCPRASFVPRLALG